MAVDGGLISLDGSGRVCTQCHMMAPDQSRLTPNVFSDAVVSTIFGFDYSEGRKERTPKWKVYEKVCKRPLTTGHKWHTCVWRVGALNIPGQVHPQFQNPQICPSVLRPRLRPPFFDAFTDATTCLLIHVVNSFGNKLWRGPLYTVNSLSAFVFFS